MFRSRAFLTVAILSLIFAAGCGSSDKKSSAKSGESTTNAAGCKEVADPKPRPEPQFKKPDLKLDPNKKYVVQVTTNCGQFEITLDVKQAPKTASSFAFLVQKKFYDGLKFHRIIPGFVIQGGDPLGTGSGGPGYSVTEAPPEDIAYTKGLVAMAKTGQEPAGTSGSQFFIVTGEEVQLGGPDYALVGKVTKGMDVVNKIGVIKPVPNSEGKPTSVVVMQQVRLLES